MVSALLSCATIFTYHPGNHGHLMILGYNTRIKLDKVGMLVQMAKRLGYFGILSHMVSVDVKYPQEVQYLS